MAHITMQSFSLPANSLALASALVMGMPVSPDAAARIIANLCAAVSLPLSAARTYHMLASRGSLRQPIPISVKYPIAYSAFGKPDPRLASKSTCPTRVGLT